MASLKVNKVQDAVIQMVVDEILDLFVKGKTAEEISAELGCSKYTADSFINLRTPLFRDVMELADLVGLDVGFAVRTSDDKEYTFFPAENFLSGGDENRTSVPSTPKTQSVYQAEDWAD